MSTLRYSETFHPPDRNTFNLFLFFSLFSSLPFTSPTGEGGRGGGGEEGSRKGTLAEQGETRWTRAREYFDTSSIVKIEIKPGEIARACPHVHGGRVLTSVLAEIRRYAKQASR